MITFVLVFTHFHFSKFNLIAQADNGCKNTRRVGNGRPVPPKQANKGRYGTIECLHKIGGKPVSGPQAKPVLEKRGDCGFHHNAERNVCGAGHGNMENLVRSRSTIKGDNGVSKPRCPHTVNTVIGHGSRPRQQRAHKAEAANPRRNPEDVEQGGLWHRADKNKGADCPHHHAKHVPARFGNGFAACTLRHHPYGQGSPLRAPQFPPQGNAQSNQGRQGGTQRIPERQKIRGKKPA